MTEIVRITDSKRKYMELLLLADEQVEMIEEYLDRGEMFALIKDREVCAVCVLTDEGGGVCELKNIAVKPEFQRRGYGRQLIGFAVEHCRGRYERLIVGTGESPLTVPFYENCGFVYTHRVRGFFTENYDHPIYEAGVLLTDKVYFEMKPTEV